MITSAITLIMLFMVLAHVLTWIWGTDIFFWCWGPRTSYVANCF